MGPEIDVTIKGKAAETLIRLARINDVSLEDALAAQLTGSVWFGFAARAKRLRAEAVEQFDARVTGDVRPGDLVTSIDQETLLVLDVTDEDALVANEWDVVNGCYRNRSNDPQPMKRHQLRRTQPPQAG